jgi:solute carrier family 39 (zinc transporter), member 1/2/3
LECFLHQGLGPTDGSQNRNETRKTDTALSILERRGSSEAPGNGHATGSAGPTDTENTMIDMSADDFTAQMTAIFILEFGVIFHSIFIGLTLALSGEEFRTLYVVLVFHQTFEGLGRIEVGSDSMAQSEKVDAILSRYSL